VDRTACGDVVPRGTSRAACVDVPALPLQLLFARRPDWRGRPVAVVGEDKPQGLVLFVSGAARRAGVRAGLRHGPTLSLAPNLRADVVPDSEIAAGVAALTKRLLAFTPGVEPLSGAPGVFHLDASGLERLAGPPATWAASILDDLASAGFRARIAVGFERFGVYAAAKTARGVVVFDTREDETRAARAAPLAALGVEPSLAETLEKLGVRTVGEFLRLPERGLFARFGADALRLRRMAAGDRAPPLARAVPEEPLEERAFFERPETDAERIAFLAEGIVARLVAKAATHGVAITGVAMRFCLERHAPVLSSFGTARPTLDAARITDLVRLRLSALRLPSGVVEATISAGAVRAREEQLRLFARRPRRDPAAAERAFARLAAEFGDDAVVVARLVEAHLPEESFAWDPVRRADAPRLRIVADPPLVRRILATPRSATRLPRLDSDVWLVSTRWWTDVPVARAYLFVAMPEGNLAWVFRDLLSEAWLLQGRGS